MDIEKNFIKTFLEKFDKIPFLVNYKNEDEFLIGEGEPQFKVILNNSISKSELLMSTSLALGEAYMNKDIEVEGDLYFALNSILSQIDKFSLNTTLMNKILHTSTHMKNQKKEVCSHYDIGNDFYSLWLDKTMSYSCAYFKSEDDSLYEAQMNKIHHILKKLNVKEGEHILDIGCGWGYLLIEAAKKYKVKGTGITLSEEQFKKFKELISKEGLEDYLDVRLMDYRELEKSNLLFDKIVSVGMLEHVGRDNYDLFFKNVDSVLKNKGEVLLHFISSLKESPGDPWIKKYIFPGGVIPSLREIINISSNYKFYTLDIESLRRDYNKTLLCWCDNFNNNIEKIEKMFDEKFIRMWELYLTSCAAAFNNGVVDIHQVLFTKGINNEIPLTREYMYK